MLNVGYMIVLLSNIEKLEKEYNDLKKDTCSYSPFDESDLDIMSKYIEQLYAEFDEYYTTNK